MKENEFERARTFTEALNALTDDGIICKDIGEDEDGEIIKAPFIRLYTN
jgi:hypothetical protein